PMELYFGRMVNHEACALMWILAALLALERWLETGSRKYGVAGWSFLFAGLWTAWPAYLLALIGAADFVFRGDARRKAAAQVLVATVVLSAALFLLHIRLVRADAWRDLGQGFALRAGAREFTWVQWVVK